MGRGVALGLVWRGEREEREREKARVLRGCAGLGLAVQRGHHVVELHRRAVDLPFFRPAAAGQFDTTGERRFAGGLSVQRYWKGRRLHPAHSSAFSALVSPLQASGSVEKRLFETATSLHLRFAAVHDGDRLHAGNARDSEGDAAGQRQ